MTTRTAPILRLISGGFPRVCDVSEIVVGGSWGSGAISTFGATVTSWRPGGDEWLFVARDAQPAPGASEHAGIPLCAPWFGVGQGDWTPPHKHGLVRLVEWDLVEVIERDDAATARLSLVADRFAGLPGAERYPVDLRFDLEVTFGARLVCSLTALSPTQGFAMDHGMHPYFAVSDLSAAGLEGLEGVAFRDYAQDGATGVADAAIRFGHHLDRVYDEAPPLILRDGDRALRLGQEGAGSSIVWSPGVEAGPTTGGLADDEWRRFVCVEYGSVQGRATRLDPGVPHTLRLTAEPLSS